MHNLKRAYCDLYKISPRFVWVSIVTGLLAGVTPFISIVISQSIINQLSSTQSPQQVMTSILIMLIIGFIGLSLSGFFSYLQSLEIGQAFRQLLFSRNLKMTTMDFKYVEDPDIKQMLWNLEIMGYSDLGSIEGIARNLHDQFRKIVCIIASLIFIVPIFLDQSSSISLLNSPWLSLVFVLLLMIATLAPALFTKWQLPKINQFTSQVYELNSLFNYVANIIYNPESGKEIRLYQQQEKINQPFVNIADENQAFNQIYRFNQQLQLKSKLLTEFLSQTLSAVLYLFIGIKILTGTLPLGYLVSATAALSLLIPSLSSLIYVLGSSLSNTKALEEHYHYMDLPNQTQVGSIPVEKRLDNDYQLSFKDVCFSYPKSDNEVLKNISVDLEVGKSYAIVGENGSGKTTFIKLLTRLYDPTKGHVLLNGIDANKYDSSQYYRLFNVVFQDFDLFSFKLGETIATTSEVDQQRIKDIFKQVGFDERFNKLEKGLETSLNKEFDPEGINLSGGEKQKLAIARALYKNGPVFVLDEPTSALDPISEFEIYQQFHQITKGKTSLIVSHRLSSCRFCDEILVFDQGQLVQQGTHDELVNQEGKYQELWQAQAKCYQENDVDLTKLSL